jgi:hypothetical protein
MMTKKEMTLYAPLSQRDHRERLAVVQLAERRGAESAGIERNSYLTRITAGG